jgi:hypothetical protein
VHPLRARRSRCERGRQRTWLVDAEFFVRNRWITAPHQRVKAGGHGGALMKGERAAKQAVLGPGQRVEQVRVTLIPVRGSAKGRSQA